jgi:hypothetical protein
MFETLFGAEMPLALRFFIAFLIVLGLIGVTAWIVRRFGSDRIGAAARGRQPRLAVIDAASVDGRRRLVLIRRDNIEHLLMIGGPTDVVIEPNIVRGAVAVPRDVPQPPRPADTLPRAVPLGEGSMWPLQPQAEPAPRPPVRAPEEQVHWQPAPEPAAPPAASVPPPPPPVQPRPPRVADPLAGLAAELSARPVPQQPAPSAPPSARQPRAQPAVNAESFASAADQNLAEMAQRLEAALRRPAAPQQQSAPMATGEDVPEHAHAAPAKPDAAAATPPRAAAPAPAEPPPSRRESRPAPSEPSPSRREGKPAPGKSLYDSLEQEMASLLGRPNSKT